MEQKKSFYITTPIYYVTARPHLGSLYSTLLADVIARWQKLYGKNIFFLTGTDEHGQKIAQAAAQVGKEPQEFVDSFIPAYKDTWKKYAIEYNKFIRTTDTQHIAKAQQFISVLLKKGDIYLGEYHGWYCTPCETFVTQKEVDPKSDTIPLCTSCNRETIQISEKTYFFKLSAYQDTLLKFYKSNPDFIAPKERLNELISFVESGLKDLSISRTTVSWGVPFPNDPEHTIYVWTEALCNYITAIGYGDENQKDMFNYRWPADVHVLGKDIVKFHGVYWPAFLMAAGLPLPKKLLVHGWINVNKQKMSKSLGNVVDPIVLYESYGVDEVRYFLIRQIPINQDGEFSTGDLEQRIESDLANDLGNLLNRMVLLAEKNNITTIPIHTVWAEKALELRDEGWNLEQDIQGYLQDYMFHLLLARVWVFIKKINSYFHEQEPWKLAKSNPEAFVEVLSATAHSLGIVAVLLWPVMPNKMKALLESLGIPFSFENNTIEDLELNIWNKKFMLKKIPPLFVKPLCIKELDQEKKQEKKVEETHFITIDDVIKVELVVGTITACEEIPESEKLLKLLVNFGDKGTRQILAGIRKWYSCDAITGKQGVFVFNLKPRKMIGYESQGMLLCAKSDDGTLQITTVDNQVANGTRLQ